MQSQGDWAGLGAPAESGPHTSGMGSHPSVQKLAAWWGGGDSVLMDALECTKQLCFHLFLHSFLHISTIPEACIARQWQLWGVKCEVTDTKNAYVLPQPSEGGRAFRYLILYLPSTERNEQQRGELMV